MTEKHLIITSDDYGVCPSINYACVEALKRGCVTSLTIMPPAPYFKQAVDLALKNNIRHMGIHLTLISEFPNLRWGPVTPNQRVPSLIDKGGDFRRTIFSFAKHAKAPEAAIELENQIKKVCRAGIKPTHLDCHMFALHYKVCKRTDFLSIIYYLCKKYKLPFRSPFKEEAAFLKKKGVKVLVDSLKGTYDIPTSKKFVAYNKILNNMRNGVSELILHCGYNTTELQNITKRSLRRQTDFDYAISENTGYFLQENKIQLIPWREAAFYLF